MISYLSLLQDIMDNGTKHKDRTGVGTTSVFGRMWRHNMSEGFPLITTKFVPLRIVFEELRWFLSGDCNRNTLQNHGVRIWDEWESPDPSFPGDMGPIYGVQWRNFFGIDQLDNLVQSIINTPNSRRMVISAWNPKEQPRMALPPCHYSFQVKVEDHKLSLLVNMRSADIFLGVPFNIASYGLLLLMLSKVTGYTPGDLVFSFGDLHLYHNHGFQANTILKRNPHPLCDVSIEESYSVGSPLSRLLNITYENVVLTNYEHHPKLPAPVAV